jgi:hypothetical protein
MRPVMAGIALLSVASHGGMARGVAAAAGWW